MIETAILIASLIVNFGLILYARWLIKILQVKEEEATNISEIVAEYVSHVKSVHEREIFECSICHEKFSRRNSMNRHMKSVHERKKSFECNLCDSKFAQKVTLNRHMKAVHE